MSSPLQAVLTAGLPPAATNTHFFFCKCIQGKRVSLPNPRGRAQHRLRSTVSQPQEGQGAHQGSGGRAVTQHSRCLRSELRAGQMCSVLRALCSVLCALCSAGAPPCTRSSAASRAGGVGSIPSTQRRNGGAELSAGCLVLRR